MDQRKAAQIAMEQAATSLDQIVASFREGGLLEELGVPRLVLDPVLRRTRELVKEYGDARCLLDGLSIY